MIGGRGRRGLLRKIFAVVLITLFITATVPLNSGSEDSRVASIHKENELVEKQLKNHGYTLFNPDSITNGLRKQYVPIIRNMEIPFNDDINVSDPEDDVIMGSPIDDLLTTDEKPNIDITRITYIKKEGSREVIVTLEVNSRGYIEDINAINPTNFSGRQVIYTVLINTSANTYYMYYTDGECTVNAENATAQVSGNKLSVTFNLSDSKETFVSLEGYSYDFEISSITYYKMYRDIVPNTLLFVADDGGPYSGKVKEEIQFHGSFIDLLNSTSPPYNYTWDFGDGSGGSGKTTAHIYQQPGNYTVTFTVKDASGVTATSHTTANITVKKDFIPPIIRFITPRKGLYINGKRVFLLPITVIIGGIKVEVKVVDYKSGVDHVEFYVDDILEEIDEAPPYNFTWSDDVSSKLRHTIKVVAYDKEGNKATREISVWKIFDRTIEKIKTCLLYTSPSPRD